MLELNLEKRAKKFLDRLPEKQAAQISRKLLSLLSDPYPPDHTLLKGIPLYKVDVGEYRAAYIVERGILHVYLIGKRNDDEVYRRLKRLGF